MVAPITGMLRKRLLTDITVSLGLGTIGGYWFWYSVHVPMMKKRDEFYIRYEKEGGYKDM